jgi:NAD+ kinase
VQRREYSYNLVTASDLVISAGGDGTFLAAAKRIRDSSIPLIGINTDPIGYFFICVSMCMCIY